MAFLPFISDETLEKNVAELLEKAIHAKRKADNQFDRNVIDPFAVLFEMAGFNFDNRTWLLNEKTRQAQKTLSNAIGSFHQKILGSVDGWKDLNTGGFIDLVNIDRKIIAEVKNKYNTVKGSDKVGVYDNLHKRVIEKGQIYNGFTAYYVEIIPKKAKVYDTFFTPSDNKQGIRRPENKLIRQIDGKSFYSLVTGVSSALELLFDAIPFVIKKIDKNNYTFDDFEYVKKYFFKAFR